MIADDFQSIKKAMDDIKMNEAGFKPGTSNSDINVVKPRVQVAVSSSMYGIWQSVADLNKQPDDPQKANQAPI